jgi:Protein kinase domain
MGRGARRRPKLTFTGGRLIAWVALLLGLNLLCAFTLFHQLPALSGRVLHLQEWRQDDHPHSVPDRTYPVVVHWPLRTPSILRTSRFSQTHSPDYGDLQYSSARYDMKRLDELYEQEREQILEEMDVPWISYYYDHYDDLDFSVQPTENAALDEANPASCERPTWGYQPHPNCNILHELPPVEHPSLKYLGHGFFRDTWLLPRSAATALPDEPPMVVKHLRFEHEHDLRFQYEIFMESLILERTTSSPTTAAIYGHCSTSVLVEAGQDVTHRIVPFHKSLQAHRGRISNKQWNELQNASNETSSHPYSFNNLTDWEKLNYAIQMAEGLAEMHGHPGGAFVHDDVHPDQWLLSLDGTRLLLNDVNNAVILSWSRQRQRYCPYWDRYDGDFRAPEVYRPQGSIVDESNDLWPMGNLIFTLLTGLFPYHNTTAYPKIQNITMEGTTPFVHEQLRQAPNYILQRLLHIMDQCHVYDPTQRPTIFAVYQFLQETRRNAIQQVAKQRGANT